MNKYTPTRHKLTELDYLSSEIRVENPYSPLAINKRYPRIQSFGEKAKKVNPYKLVGRDRDYIFAKVSNIFQGDIDSIFIPDEKYALAKSLQLTSGALVYLVTQNGSNFILVGAKSEFGVSANTYIEDCLYRLLSIIILNRERAKDNENTSN